MAAHKVLKKHKLTSFIKTSGKTGLHIYIPFSNLSYAQARTIAYKIAYEIHTLVPKVNTREESIDLRGDKVYINAGGAGINVKDQPFFLLYKTHCFPVCCYKYFFILELS